MDSQIFIQSIDRARKLLPNNNLGVSFFKIESKLKAILRKIFKRLEYITGITYFSLDQVHLSKLLKNVYS